MTSRATSIDVLARCAEFAATVRARDAPPEVRARLRLQTASVLAATFAADEDERARRVTSWARRVPGPHPLLPFGEGVGRLEAIVGSVTRASARDFDDFALVGRCGPPSIVVPLVLAGRSTPWSEIDDAQLAAVETSLRFGVATALGDAPARCVPAVAAAVAAARVLGLDGARMREAIAMASVRDDALSGVLAAELAFEGARADVVSPPLADGAFGALSEAWFAETIHPHEHAAKPAAQTAIDAAQEVAAQVRAVRKRALQPSELAHVDIETTIFGAIRTVRAPLVERVLSTLGCPGFERVRVRHAWDLTSELLFHVGGAIDPTTLYGSAAARDLAFAPLRLRAALGAMDLEGPSLGDVVSQISRTASTLRRRAGPARGLRGLALPLATRLSIVLRDGARFAADRTTTRTAPGAKSAPAIVRDKLVSASSARLGRRRAERLFALLVEPSARLTVGEVLDALAK